MTPPSYTCESIDDSPYANLAIWLDTKSGSFCNDLTNLPVSAITLSLAMFTSTIFIDIADMIDSANPGVITAW